MFDNEGLIRQAPRILGDFSPLAAFAAFSPRNHMCLIRIFVRHKVISVFDVKDG
jgi:hypothetical protein